MKSKPVIIITMGDAQGIGPEVIVKALTSAQIKKLECRYLIVGSAEVLTKAAGDLGIKFCAAKLTEPDASQNPDNICVFEPDIKSDSPARMALEYILTGINLMKSGRNAALVTAPVSKEAIQKSGVPFTGHTEILAQKTVSRRVTMMFTAPKLKVALATTHIAYRKVPLHLTTDQIISSIEQTDEGLRNYFGVIQPKIAVCGLNPHAGENKAFGNEEGKIIKPAIELARRRRIKCDGPFPADSIFRRAIKGEFDAVVAMYHDQGLVAVKTLTFEQAVQVTLGLPFIRTSPAHGVAYDIAGKGIADPTSMIEAIKLAAEMGSRANLLF